MGEFLSSVLMNFRVFPRFLRFLVGLTPVFRETSTAVYASIAPCSASNWAA